MDLVLRAIFLYFFVFTITRVIGRRELSELAPFDIILLIAVGGTALVTVWHYFSERNKARKAEAAGEDVVTDHEEAEELVLDPDVFDRPPHLDGHEHPHHGHDGHGGEPDQK